MAKDSFLARYNGHRFVDAGAYCSDDFKAFARAFKSYLKRNLPEGCEVVEHRCGHYDVSGFVTRDGKYVYYSWSWNRCTPLDVNAGGCHDGVLFRTAKSEKDFKGGWNHFCPMTEIPERIGQMLGREAK